MPDYIGKHRRPQGMDERAADARAAGLCSSCEGKRSDLGDWCRSCGGLGTAQAETDRCLDGILADLAANDAR